MVLMIPDSHPLIEDPGEAMEPMLAPFCDFWAPGVPKPQPRPKAQIVKSEFGEPYVHIYTPDNKTHDHARWRESVWRAAQIILPPEEIPHPIALTVMVYLKRPQAMMTKSWFDGPIPHAKQGDLDNFIKAIEDALNPIPGKRRGLWRDDGLVFFYRQTGKFYAGKNKPTGAYVRLDLIDPASQVARGGKIK